MTFLTLSALAALLITGFLCFALLFGRRASGPAAAFDLNVYREQLAGVDRDLARGVIAEADAERVRTEISRRILAADAQMRDETKGAGPSRTVTAIALVVISSVLIGGAFGLYRQMGAAGFPDMPLSARLELANELRENRPSQAAAEAQATPVDPPQLDSSYAELLEQLRETVAARPDDLQGQILLAQHETNAGNFRAGYSAQARAIELSGDAASADNYSDLAEMMILAAGGYVSPEAEQALRMAFERDADHGPARYYWGQMLAQIGRPDLAYRIWVETLRSSPVNAPWAQAIRSQIEPLAFRAGVFNGPDLSASGPTQDDMQAASELSAEERQEMIQGMVNQLADRLATDGGSPQEWARLIAALGVLGETDRAAAARDEAVALFSENAEALQVIDLAAQQAGITQ